MKERFKVKIHIIPIIFIGILVAFDQLVKNIIINYFDLYESKSIIKNILDFTYVRNEGAAWGMFAGGRYIFIILTMFVFAGIFYIYSNIYSIKRYNLLKFALVVLVAGAIGNLIDRVQNGYVIDFIDVNFFNFPVFNIADIYVVVSLIITFVLLLLVYNNEEFDEIMGKKNDGKNNDNDQ